MYSLYRKIEAYDSIVIFGASDIGMLIENEIKVYCEETGKSFHFADNSYKKRSGQQNILQPVDAAAKYPGATWIIASERHSQSMFNELRQLNIDEKDIIIKIPADILFRKQIAEKLKRLTPQGTLLQFDVDVANHCNLNCAGCNAFSPLIKEPMFADIGTFNRDMSRLSYLLQGNLHQINLLGGEPLLNPQIEDFIISARKHFPNTKVTLLTNGMLLHKMSKSFWNTCLENMIIISVTRYPINFNYDELPAIAQKHGIEFEYFGIAVEKTSWNLALDPSGMQDPYESFSNCFQANKCVRLKNGKLATCPPILNIEIFNKEFGTNMEARSDDYIDIYKAKSGCELLDFLSKPIPFCRFCDVKNWTFDNPWRTSKREIGEWVLDNGKNVNQCYYPRL